MYGRPSPFVPDHPTRAQHGELVLVDTFLGPSPIPNPGADDGPHPQAFHIEMGPGSSLDVHFHELEQFQVIVSGSARLGRHAVAPRSVHYTDAQTPYGPLVPGDQGVGYLTLRRHSDTRTHYMPSSRDRLQVERAAVPGRRHRNISVDATTSSAELEWDLVESDGVRVGHVTLDADDEQTLEIPSVCESYLVIADGVAMTTSADGHREWLPPVSWVPAGTGTIAVAAVGWPVTAIITSFGAAGGRSAPFLHPGGQ